MICIVVAQNVMCLYVQMCMSILRVFIIFSVAMVGWLLCLFAVSLLLRCFSIHHQTCYLPHSSWHGIDYLLRISNMKIHILQLLSHKCWVASQSSARLDKLHAWNLYKQSVSHNDTSIMRPSRTSSEEYGWTLNKVISLNTNMWLPVSYLPSIRAKQNSPSSQTAPKRNTTF